MVLAFLTECLPELLTRLRVFAAGSVECRVAAALLAFFVLAVDAGILGLGFLPLVVGVLSSMSRSLLFGFFDELAEGSLLQRALLEKYLAKFLAAVDFLIPLYFAGSN